MTKMKFFLPESGNEFEEVMARRNAYRAYVDAFRDQLPEGLLVLCDFSPGWSLERISMNDASITEIQSSFSERTIRVELLGDAHNEYAQMVAERVFKLSYSGVESFTVGETANVLNRYYGAGYHLADEIDLAGDGLFEHRMLFAYGVVVSIVFRNFHLEYFDIPYPPRLESKAKKSKKQKTKTGKS